MTYSVGADALKQTGFFGEKNEFYGASRLDERDSGLLVPVMRKTIQHPMDGSKNALKMNVSMGMGIRDVKVHLDGVEQKEGKDFIVQGASIAFNHIPKIGSMVNAEYEEYDMTISGVMLLSRKNPGFEFSDEDLDDFRVDSVLQVFDIDRLIKNFPSNRFLAEHAGMGAKIIAAATTPDGVMASIEVVKK